MLGFMLKPTQKKLPQLSEKMRNKSKWHVCMKCEQFPRKVVELLRDFGHNVLTVQEAGNASLPDDNVLEFAINQNRAVLTLDRRDFQRLR
jgi:hypothetical protein